MNSTVSHTKLGTMPNDRNQRLTSLPLLLIFILLSWMLDIKELMIYIMRILQALSFMHFPYLKKNKLWEEIPGIIKFIMKDLCHNLVNLSPPVTSSKNCIWSAVILRKISQRSREYETSSSNFTICTEANPDPRPRVNGREMKFQS